MTQSRADGMTRGVYLTRSPFFFPDDLIVAKAHHIDEINRLRHEGWTRVSAKSLRDQIGHDAVAQLFPLDSGYYLFRYQRGINAYAGITLASKPPQLPAPKRRRSTKGAK